MLDDISSSSSSSSALDTCPLPREHGFLLTHETIINPTATTSQLLRLNYFFFFVFYSCQTARQRQIFHFAATSAILCLSLTVALVVGDLGIVLSVVGATGSTTVSYIIPGVAYFRLFPHPHKKRRAAVALFLVGCGIMPVALVGIALRT